MNDLINQIENVLKRAKEISGESSVFNSTSSVRRAKIALAQAHLEQAIRVLEDN